MNAECRELRPLLSAYMDNELTPDELRVVQAHVATCPDCAAVLREYRQVRSSMRALSQPVPPAELRAAVFARATPAHRRRAAVVTFGQRGLSYAALAAAVVAIFITGALLLRSGVGPAIMGAPDTTPPRITALDPLPNVDAWGLNKPIRITFSEPMDQASVVAALSISADPPLSEAERLQLLQSAKWEGNTLVIGEGVALQPYTDYTISIDANRAHDKAQNALQGAENTFKFRTVDVVAAPPTPTAIVAVAPPSPSPTATPRPTEPPITATSAAPSPPPTARPTDAPVVATNPTPTSAAAFTPPPTTAPVQPTATPTTAKPPAPTATTAAPTATPQPTNTPTQTPPTPTAPAPTTTTPVRSPYAVGQAFAPVYAAAAETLGLPTANEASVPGSYLAFEGGWMIWRGDTRTIYVLFNENPLVWYAFADGWVDGMEPGGGPATKAGRYLPPRGFNKVWTENPDVQRRLGFALTPNETSGTITIQPFERGLMLASNLGTPTVYIFYQNNLFEAYPR